MVTVALAGDISGQADVAAAVNGSYLAGHMPTYWLPMGDMAYPDGGTAAFANHDSQFHAVKSIARPVMGNHEVISGSPNAYYAYYGTLARPAGNPWYAADLGNGWRLWSVPWHGAYTITAGSTVYNFFQADRQAFPKAHIILCHHWARFNYGDYGDSPLLQDLFALSASTPGINPGGHVHYYERQRERNANGAVVPPGTGMLPLSVGTGGGGLDPIVNGPNLVVGYGNVFGVGVVNLRTDGYDFQFIGTGTGMTGGTYQQIPPTVKDSYSANFAGPTGGNPPVAAFSASQTAGTNTVVFANTSTGATSYSWNFGDGSGASTVTNPSHTYSTTGTFTVTLVASNAAGSNTVAHPVTVNATVVVPTAGFVASNTTGTTVQFTDTSSGSPTSWSWTFGDGGTSIQQNPSHTYAAAGSYNVTLTVSNSAGTSAPHTSPVVVGAAAAINWTPISLVSAVGIADPAGVAYVFSTGTPVGQPVTWAPAPQGITIINDPSFVFSGGGGLGGTGFRIQHLTVAPNVEVPVLLDAQYRVVEVLNRSLGLGEVYFTVDGSRPTPGGAGTYVAIPNSSLQVPVDVIQTTVVTVVSSTTVPVTVTGIIV